ncbi:hypothetical protein FACS1894123_01780 [Bacteroidia bacterium]|nr:hypothetical protein FACS1894123_01780 [Bacteroidia bacterium]
MKIYRLFAVVFVTFLFCNQLFAQQTQLTNLPTIYINTEQKKPITSTETYIKTTVIVVSSDPTENLNMTAQIRGRGNSTWGMPKKPYRLKLDKKTRLLNLPAKEKDWVLLANCADKSLIRNAIAGKIGELVGLKFSPSARFVDVVLNGTYMGNYQVTDQIEVGEKRVDVQEQKATPAQPSVVTGGFLIESGGAAEYPNFRPSSGLNMSIKYPDYKDYGSAQWGYLSKYVTDYVNNFDKILFSKDFTDPEKGYRAWVDTTSLINWYIACELSGNSDSFWSTYMYKYNSSDKLYFGPLWDYDIAFNNDNRMGNAVQKLMREIAHEPRTWIARFSQDQWFKSAVNKRWQELVDENILQNLLDYVNSLTVLIDKSQEMNFKKWNIRQQNLGWEQQIYPTYKESIDYLLYYLKERVSYLTDRFSRDVPGEPFHVENYYYVIANRKTGNLIDVENNSTDENGKMVMWEPLEKDMAQQWIFNALGDDKYQIVNRNSGFAMSYNGSFLNVTQITKNPANTKQHWHVVPVGNNLFGLVNDYSKQSINNSGGGSLNGNPVITYTERITESENQQWYIRKKDAITSIKEISPKNQIQVFPNPIQDVLNVRLPDNETATTITVNIFGLDGKCLFDYQVKADKNQLAIPVSNQHINSGIYILKVQTEPNIYFTKFIKN